MNKTKLLSLAVIVLALLVCSIVTAPKIPDDVPDDPIRDQIITAKLAEYSGGRPWVAGKSIAPNRGIFAPFASATSTRGKPCRPSASLAESSLAASSHY